MKIVFFLFYKKKNNNKYSHNRISSFFLLMARFYVRNSQMMPIKRIFIKLIEILNIN